MAERIVLHVGAPKSGTTYLQSVLWNNKPALTDAGILLPGRARFSHTRVANVFTSGVRKANKEFWSRMVDQVREWPGTVLLSDEWFVRAGRPGISRAFKELRCRDVRVVFTARDFARQVPAAWQEELKLGYSTSLHEFVAALGDASAKWSWRTLDAAEALQEWSGVCPSDGVTVVTLPRSGAPRDLLWRRFAAAVGFEPGIASLDSVDVNESLSAEAAAFLARFGPQFRDAVVRDDDPWQAQYKWLRRYLGHELLVPLRGSRIRLSESDFEVVRRQTEKSSRVIESAGWKVEGDLADLAAAEFSPREVDPDTVTAEQALAVAGALAVRLLAEVRQASDSGERED